MLCVNIMNAGEGTNTGDIVSAKKGNAAEEYYRFMLLKAKLDAAKEGADALLTVQSEREAIEIDILRNLVKITESSPEFSQIVDITGSRDRYEQARILSEVVYDKVRAEKILGFYTPNKDALESHFTTRTELATTVRQSGSAQMSQSIRKSATNAFAKALGLSKQE